LGFHNTYYIPATINPLPGVIVDLSTRCSVFCEVQLTIFPDDIT
jgi:hypothetical protein